MLTRKNSTTKWKFAMALPLLLGCSVLFAKSETGTERTRNGNVTTFKGHQFTWFKQELSPSMQKGVDEGRLDYKYVAPRITHFDQEEVLYFAQTSVEPYFRVDNRGFTEYMTTKFKEHYKGKLDSLSQIGINNVVVSSEGKIVYYELTYMGRTVLPKGAPELRGTPEIERVIDKVIAESPAWQPAARDGKLVSFFVLDPGAIVLNSFSARISLVE